ncbi:hypothetical protein BC826DRAFT_1054203, partial [Russula brevipes]
MPSPHGPSTAREPMLVVHSEAADDARTLTAANIRELSRCGRHLSSASSRCSLDDDEAAQTM